MRTLFSISLLILFCSCSSIVSHTSWPVTFRSEPAGATITILNRDSMIVYQGTTPATVQLEGAAGYMRRGKFQVKLSMPGYSDKVIPLHAILNPWYLGNVVSWSFIGVVVDPATGAMWRIREKDVLTQMQQAGANKGENQILVLLPGDVKPEWKPFLEPVIQ